jgi:hypothetical protein
MELRFARNRIALTSDIESNPAIFERRFISRAHAENAPNDGLVNLYRLYRVGRIGAHRREALETSKP